MNPNDTLDELRKMSRAASVEQSPDQMIGAMRSGGEDELRALREFTEAFDALDLWLRLGGAPPAEWADGRAQIPLGLANVDQMTARHALWEFGYGGLAIEPSGFVRAMFNACMVADTGNLQRIALAFPDIASAVHIGATWNRGIRALTDIAAGGDGDVS